MAGYQTACGTWWVPLTDASAQFPAPLRGPVWPDRLELTPEDPVDLLFGKIDAAEPAVRAQRPAMLASLSRLRDRIDARAGELRREVPCLAHTDANFHNIIVATDHVTLIDWDNPAVRYPLEELEALEEHSYLNGIPELPAAFFAGYGREVSRPATSPPHDRVPGNVQLDRVVRPGSRHPIPKRPAVHDPWLERAAP